MKSHSKFLVFVADPQDGLLPSSLCATVEQEVKSKGLAPKSIGVEYLEGRQKVVLSLGYNELETGYPIKLQAIRLGKLGLDPQAIASAMETAASKVNGVICHEFYVLGDEEYVLVVMTLA